MRRWALLLALMLSVGVNVGILSVLAVHRLRPPRPPATQPGAPAVAPGTLRGMPTGIERLADHLGLEGERRERFVELQRGFFEAAPGRQRRLFELRRQLRRELTSRRPDRARVEALLAEIGRATAEAEGAMARLVLDSRELLDRRQQRVYLRLLARLRGHAERQRPGLRGPPPSP